MSGAQGFDIVDYLDNYLNKYMSDVTYNAKLSPQGCIPTRGSLGAAGYDLYACLEQDISINAGHRVMISTGVSIEIPEGFYGKIEARSSLAFKYGVIVLAGVVDSDYRGEIKVILFNSGTEILDIKHGDRIAQIIFHKHEIPKLVVVENLSSSVRNLAGFGSTGV